MKFGYLEYFSMFFSYKELYMTNTIHCIHWLGFNRKENKKKLQSQKMFNCQKRKRFSLSLGKNINQPKNSPWMFLADERKTNVLLFISDKTNHRFLPTKTLLLRRNRVKLIMQEHSYSYLHESIQDFFSLKSSTSVLLFALSFCNRGISVSRENMYVRLHQMVSWIFCSCESTNFSRNWVCLLILMYC